MIDKRLRSGITERKLIISAVALLHFDSSITRFMSGSKCNLGCLGGYYKLLRGYPSRSLITIASGTTALSTEGQQSAISN